MNSKTKLLAMNAIIAALYVALTLALQPISYGEIQCRISEVLVLLAFYDKKYFPGLIAGCAIANLWSPMVAYDMVFGVGATIIAVLAMNKCPNIWLAALCGAVANGILVGIELHLAFEIPLVINAIYVFIGEFIALAIGALIFKFFVEKNAKLMELIL